MHKVFWYYYIIMNNARNELYEIIRESWKRSDGTSTTTMVAGLTLCRLPPINEFDGRHMALYKKAVVTYSMYTT